MIAEFIRIYSIFMIIFNGISQIFNSQFKVLNQVHWLSYIEIFCLKFTGYWQEIIKNTASYNQGDYEFKIINKFKQWSWSGWSFISFITRSEWYTGTKSSSKTSMPSILSTHLVLQTSLSLCFKILGNTAVFCLRGSFYVKRAN